MTGPAATTSHEARIARFIDELRRPAAYPHSVDEVGFLQTHISLLFFAGERVYKVKKPVDLGFLDFTLLDRRLHFCREEVRLNRRLAAKIYLGVCPITRATDGRLCVRGEGEIVEWAVEMVRLPAERMFDRLLDRGEIDNAQMNGIAALLGKFHGHAATGEGVDDFGSPEAVRGNVEENFEQLEPFVHPPGERAPGLVSARMLEFLRKEASAFLTEHRELVARRVTEGKIRECHGDLHAGNICFSDEIVIYDCIEFSRRLRCGDVAADIAFLAMDLDCRGYPAFAAYLVKRYAQEVGDVELEFLMGFYKAYRAVVRGKVAALTTLDAAAAGEERESLRREAMRYLHLAAAYHLPPVLILMCGLPASGKSWLAKHLAPSLRASHLRSDVRRKVRAGSAPATRVRAGYAAGLYSDERKEATYLSLLESSLETLGKGRSVIVDATFSKRKYRAWFVDAATRMDYPCYVLHVVTSARETEKRLESRSADPSEPSDADAAIYRLEQDDFESPDEISTGQLLRLTSGDEHPEMHCALLLDRMIDRKNTAKP